MNLNIYNINWSKWLIAQLPIALRTAVRWAWLKLFIIYDETRASHGSFHSIDFLHRTLLSFFDTARYKLQHNGQVVYLQKALNDAFDPSERRIIVRNLPLSASPVFHYDRADGKPVFYYDAADNKPVYFYDYTGEIGADFEVICPNEMNEYSLDPIMNEIEMSKLIDYYKIYSKNYQFKWV